ncbi:SDR family NAD(P)-dependent oxidoreductase [Streptomyces bobili]|uniref:SDR family NAD(P)-dependent oxidoreductase n=1 Tax=Streptomyces bobili TaxID=67280 RepID=UPI0033AA7321
MDLSDARGLLAGTTGVLGGALTAEPAGRGACPASAGPAPTRRARLAQACPGAPTVRFEAHDPAPCARPVHDATVAPGGLDAVVAAFGAVAVGRASEVADERTEHLDAVNILASAAFLRAALTIMGPGPVNAAFTGVLAEHPQAGTADHSASKAVPGVWLGAVRREVRARGIHVPEAGPGHLDTGFADRPVAGAAPPTPAVGGPHRDVAALAAARETDAEPLLTALDSAPVVERRAG